MAHEGLSDDWLVLSGPLGSLGDLKVNISLPAVASSIWGKTETSSLAVTRLALLRQDVRRWQFLVDQPSPSYPKKAGLLTYNFSYEPPKPRDAYEIMDLFWKRLHMR